MVIVQSNATSVGMRRTWIWLVGAVVIVLAGLAAETGSAQQADTGKFSHRGVTLDRASGLYYVTQDVQARETPDNNGKRREPVDEGAKVRAFGRSGSWLAVRDEEGRDIGFLPSNLLYALFDGALESDLTGELALAGGRKCSYTVRYTGSSPIEGEPFATSDYDVIWRCTIGDAVREFAAFAFVTLAAEGGRKDPVYQLTMDIWEIAGEAQDQVFSTTMMYDQGRARVSFDSVSIASFADKAPAPQAARTVPEVLRKGLEIAVSSWNDDAWKAIGGIAKKGSASVP